jgi:hypothetical protein
MAPVTRRQGSYYDSLDNYFGTVDETWTWPEDFQLRALMNEDERNAKGGVITDPKTITSILKNSELKMRFFQAVQKALETHVKDAWIFTGVLENIQQKNVSLKQVNGIWGTNASGKVLKTVNGTAAFMFSEALEKGESTFTDASDMTDQDIIELKKDYDNLRLKNSALKDQLDKANSENSKLNEALDTNQEARFNLGQMETTRDALTTSLNSVTKERDLLNNKLGQMQSDFSTATQRNTYLEVTLQKQNKEMQMMHSVQEKEVKDESPEYFLVKRENALPEVIQTNSVTSAALFPVAYPILSSQASRNQLISGFPYYSQKLYSVTFEQRQPRDIASQLKSTLDMSVTSERKPVYAPASHSTPTFGVSKPEPGQSQNRSIGLLDPFDLTGSGISPLPESRTPTASDTVESPNSNDVFEESESELNTTTPVNEAELDETTPLSQNGPTGDAYTVNLTKAGDFYKITPKSEKLLNGLDESGFTNVLQKAITQFSLKDSEILQAKANTSKMNAAFRKVKKEKKQAFADFINPLLIQLQQAPIGADLCPGRIDLVEQRRIVCKTELEEGQRICVECSA